MRNVSLAKAFSLFAQTRTFVPWRLGLALAGVIALVLSIMIGTSVERYLFGPEATDGVKGLPGILIGLLLWMGLIAALRGLVLARIRVPHFAAMAASMSGGTGQIALPEARAMVAAQLGRVGALAKLDRLLRAVVRGIARLVDEGVPADETGMTGPRAFGMRLYRGIAAGPLAEVILGYAAQDRSEDGWDLVHDGSVLLAQNNAQILGRAGRLVLAGWLLSLLVFLCLLEPLILAAQALVGAEAGWSLALAVALGLSWGSKAAVIDPVIFGCLLQLFRSATADQTPNAEWRGLLAHALPAFRKLGEGADSWSPRRATVATGDV
jgi:hypothetical protein